MPITKEKEDIFAYSFPEYIPMTNFTEERESNVYMASLREIVWPFFPRVSH